jgi:hypothetical protein
MRFVDLWASLFPASLPPAPGLTVAVNGSGWLLSSNKILPMLGTLGQDCIPQADL